MSRKNASLADTFFALARVLNSFAAIGAHLIGAVHRANQRRQTAGTDALRDQTTILKNQLTAYKIAHEQEKIRLTIDKQVKSSLDIDNTHLKLAQMEFKLWTAGIIQEKDLQYYRPKKHTATFS